MKIAICDDNKQELENVIQLVNEYFSCILTEEKIDILTFSSSLKLIDQIESGKQFDVYLLDIIMPNIDGIKLASEIRKHDQVAKIIFLTSSAEFAVDSYSVNAFFYLMKPIQKDKFFSVLESVCNNISRDLKQHIIVKTKSGLSKLYLNELIYVEVSVRTVCFHLKGGKKLVSTSTISQIETVLLNDKRFIKPHRSYVINLDFIKNISQSGFVTTTDILIPISRNAYKMMKLAYINHSFQPKN